ncbi:iron-siderophore ABC transporter substrate-binding protein [Nocardioides deserti]|uniref:Iron-siderophore ABC transporter substrate-binding protein n=1 Tax=Nocardioides deserti TaxID=1588644 RepID=A0ABR6U6E6_9ACTN|nr:iron-siderophore ABC transporter substrate-binding protein [Nocardioides deserti]MBC2959960.1 iron-siderophore ABC transporter substrate-binding protein [Nocardioides deserti]GGO75339.1 ABC transporter substrate-binding protein [Nocardioides deserti]
MRSLRLLTASLGAAALVLSACGSSDDEAAADAPSKDSSSSAEFPITIEHALGTTTIEEEPERVATVAWANHEVPLALGVVPVGMAAANFGDDDGDGLLPWVSDELEELGAETPVLFDETDGIDFEAVADTEPDLILASYSGLTQEDYDTLTEIAPTIAYPEAPWSTEWRDMILQSSEAMGMAAEGEELVADLEAEITEAVDAHPGLAGKKTMFLTHVDTTDLSEVSYYTTQDTRAKFFTDLGLATPASIEEASQEAGQFSGTLSAEQVDKLDDVEVIVTYGDQELVEALESDPLLSKMPAVENDAIVLLPNTPLGTAANPTPLSISYVLEDYVAMLAKAAGAE